MGETIRVTAKKVSKEIILSENTTEKMKYAFSGIKSSFFLWRKEWMRTTNAKPWRR